MVRTQYRMDRIGRLCNSAYHCDIFESLRAHQKRKRLRQRCLGRFPLGVRIGAEVTEPTELSGSVELRGSDQKRAGRGAACSPMREWQPQRACDRVARGIQLHETDLQYRQYLTTNFGQTSSANNFTRTVEPRGVSSLATGPPSHHAPCRHPAPRRPCPTANPEQKLVHRLLGPLRQFRLEPYGELASFNRQSELPDGKFR